MGGKPVTLVVVCSIFVELIVRGGLAQKLVVHGENVITPFNNHHCYGFYKINQRCHNYYALKKIGLD
jgi:hypothetical protein